MERWTRRVVRHRKKIIAGWLVLLVLGGLAAANLGGLLSNRFSVPGSDAERGLDLLKERFNERGDGAFTLVFRTNRPVAHEPSFRRRAFAVAERGATAVSGAEPGPVLPASARVAYVQIYTPLENADAADKTPAIRDAIPIDYSMLVVFRYREELVRHESPTEALVATMRTAGRATLFSGATVAIGLALLVFMPLPFMRSMGIGGLLVPLVSITASATFLPAVLAVLGRKVNRFRLVPRRVLEARAEGR